MTIRVGINGFGRIGRLATRAMLSNPSVRLVHINEPMSDSAASAHLLMFDSVHGRLDVEVRADESTLSIGHADTAYSVTYTRFNQPAEIPWAETEVDIVLECSGLFRTVESVEPHLEQGAKKVVVSAPVQDDQVPNIVVGCNDDSYQHDQHDIVTAASCTTNRLAPVVKVLHEAIGIERGVVTTIHDVTNTQVIVDTAHKDLRRARSALNSLIPTSTGSATAIGLIFPEWGTDFAVSSCPEKGSKLCQRDRSQRPSFGLRPASPRPWSARRRSPVFPGSLPDVSLHLIFGTIQAPRRTKDCSARSRCGGDTAEGRPVVVTIESDYDSGRPSSSGTAKRWRAPCGRSQLARRDHCRRSPPYRRIGSNTLHPDRRRRSGACRRSRPPHQRRTATH